MRKLEPESLSRGREKRSGFIAEVSDELPIVHLLYRKAVDLRIRLVLSKLDFCVKPVSDLQKFLESNTASRHGLVIVDVGSELASGGDIVEQLTLRFENTLVLPVCTNGSIDFFRRCFRAGVVDVLDKSFDDQRIAEALAAIKVLRYRQPSVLASIHKRQLRFESLTQREREVFRYLVDGLTNRKIGQLLALSTRTVEAHRAHIRQKLCVRSVAQMASEYSGCIEVL
jgi:FixJ family two-component response regulator